MRTNFDLSDVPVVDASDLAFVIELLRERGQGLALLRGLREDEIREIEDAIWAAFDDESMGTPRLAVALRFRALLQAFSGRRLKALFLERGFRLLAFAAQDAAARPLNVRFGFNAQRMLLALDASTARPLHRADDLPLAA
ncbi:MAG: hypothetical protein JSR78_01180 [Proteobacteria bacterium]|nr:hypothetical protein [Pseudomonadota bacterium]